jgi:hypothetical protein
MAINSYIISQPKKRLNYFSSTFQRTNSVFLSQQISISINISQISAKRTGPKNLQWSQVVKFSGSQYIISFLESTDSNVIIFYDINLFGKRALFSVRLRSASSSCPGANQTNLWREIVCRFKLIYHMLFGHVQTIFPAYYMLLVHIKTNFTIALKT